MQTQEWARCLQRLRVHQIAHKLTDNNDKIEQNPCPVPASSRCECEFVRVKQLNLDSAGILVTCNLLGLEHIPHVPAYYYQSVPRGWIKPLFIWRQEFLSGCDYCDWFLIGRPLPVSLSLALLSQSLPKH